MRHVARMGGIWRLSDRSFDKMMKALEAREDVDLDKYGKQVVQHYVHLECLQDEALMKKKDELDDPDETD